MRPRSALLMLTCMCASAGPAGAQAPRFNYILHCQGCHLADGSETPGRIPALTGAGKFLSTDGGRAFLVQVPGVSLSVIEDGDLAALLNWMLETFSPNDLPEGFLAYTPEEVARLRSSPLIDVESARARLLEALEEQNPGAQRRVN